jgi:hypothetical protein
LPNASSRSKDGNDEDHRTNRFTRTGWVDRYLRKAMQ